MNEYFNQKINCNVEDCKHCNNLDNTCTLGKITVETIKEKSICSKEGTFCNSYEKRDIIKELTSD